MSSDSGDDATFDDKDNHSESAWRKSDRLKIIKETKRNSRHNRRKVKSQSDVICPICDLTLRPGDFGHHYEYEYQKLAKILNPNLKPISGQGRTESSENLQGHSEQETSEGSNLYLHSEQSNDDASQPSTSNALRYTNRKVEHRPNDEEFQRVKVNRLLRRQCSRWRAKDLLQDETVCPSCQEPVPVESPEELQVHVEQCLNKRQGGFTPDQEEVEMDVEGDEYEWCGMRKIRITSLLKTRGQLHALGTMISKGDEDGDVDVCVESEGEEFGPPQYFQEDLDAVSYHRSDMIAGEENRSPGSIPGNDDARDKSPDPHNEDVRSAVQVQKTEEDPTFRSRDAVVMALRMKLRELEERGSVICHVCHGPYSVPVVSTVCWHVYCEKCWLQALATQKLCPQCKYIVSPTDLRKIYL